MNKKFYPILAAGAAALCLALSACSAESGSPEVIQVSAGEASIANIITVSGKDIVKIVPDMAEIVFVVSTEDEDSLKCQQQNSELVDDVIEYLKGQNLDDSSIKTTGYNLGSNYEWRNGEQEFVGYEMTTRITVSDVTIDNAGKILAGAVSAGANGVRSVNYYSSEYDAAYDEALTKAIDQAIDKARTLAEAGGNTLGKIVQIEEHSDSQQGRYVSSNISIDTTSMFGNGDGDDDFVPVMAGVMEVSADVTVVFECE